MKKLKTDLFDRSNPNGEKAQMELTHSSSNTNHSNNFEFAFNSINFSDHVLRIEVVTGASESKSEGEECSSLADWARNRKRRREEIKREKAAEFDDYNSDNIVSCNQPDIEDAVAFESHYAEAVVASPTGDSRSMDCSPVLRVNTMYVSSAILAAKSPFFYKLFSNGMLESYQRHATLRICASEEAALMELLSFMYSGKLSTNSPPHVLDVLMAADKFDVASCMRYCSQLLRSQSMTPESALLYLELPSSVSMASVIQPLTDAAREFLASKFRAITKFQDEVMNLPLAGIEAILSSDNLRVASEDAVYDFVLKWARARYPKAEDRREILGSHLARLIRFPFMTCWKLKEVLTCNDLDHEISSKAVLEALIFKAEMPHTQQALASDDPAANRRYIERSYWLRPVKVVEFESPHLQGIVYLDLKKEECVNLFPGGRVCSQVFQLGGEGFFLYAQCNMDHQNSFHCFGLFLGMLKGLVTVDYQFAARAKPTGDFVDLVSKHKGYYNSKTGGKVVGYNNPFATTWASFMADDSLYFINGILHLRAELTIKQTQPLLAPAASRDPEIEAPNLPMFEDLPGQG